MDNKHKRFIKSYGVSNNFVKKSNDKDEIFINKVKWIGKYDGKKADIDLDINNNGEKKHYDIELNNEQIKDLLNMHSVNKPLENRLLEDYLTETKSPVVEELISYKMPTSVSASASKRSKSRSSRSSSKRSKSSSNRRLPTNVSRLRTSISHSRGSLNKGKSKSKSRKSIS